MLIGGLCLSRNLGGPAMGLTMVDEIRKRIPGVRFKFAVHPRIYEMEQEWAQRYGLEIVPRLGIQEYYRLRFAGILRFFGKAPASKEGLRALLREVLDSYEWADVIVNNEGISYVGDGTRRIRISVLEHSGYQFSRIKKRPYARFIQSYGPFDDWRVRWLAKRELSSLPFVFARGQESADFCSTVANSDLVHCVPDSAIVLGMCDENAGYELLKELGLQPKNYVVLSPSAVLVNAIRKETPGSIGAKHIESMVSLASELLKRGERVLFLPHMYSRVLHECDREVCRKVIGQLPESDAVKLVERDIDAKEAKWLISNSRQCVVSRYHALVAAISTATPVVTIGWNVKYRDLLGFYGGERMAVDAREYEPAALCEEVLARLATFDQKMVEKVGQRQRENAQMVYQAFDRLTAWMEEVT